MSFTYMEFYNMWPIVTGFMHLAYINTSFICMAE